MKYWRWLLCGCVLLQVNTTQCDTTALLLDPDIQRGVQLAPFRTTTSSPRFITRNTFNPTCLPTTDCSQHPTWVLQQWHTAQDIAAATPHTDTHGDTVWQLYDAQGRWQKQLQLGSGGAMLGLNGLSEFAAQNNNGIPTYLPDLRSPWPHLLLSQDTQSERLSHYAALPLHIRFRITEDTPQSTADMNPALHAARLVLALTVRNRLSGNFFWITVPLYDSRTPSSGFGCNKCDAAGRHCYTPHTLTDPGYWHCPEDRAGEAWWKNDKPGTGRMIFRIPTAALVQPQTEGWQLATGDVLPYVQAGLEAARQRANGKRFPKDLFFYELGRLSLGWEITGFNRARAQFTTVQLYGETK